METIIKRVRKNHPNLTDEKILIISKAIRYHDGKSQILSKELFEKEIESSMIKSGMFDCWTTKHTRFFIYENRTLKRWV
jgi:hypothetical protein